MYLDERNARHFMEQHLERKHENVIPFVVYVVVVVVVIAIIWPHFASK